MLPDEDNPSSIAAEVPGVADEAYETTVRTQGSESLYFRHIMARQNAYFVVTWMTGEMEPSPELTKLAQRISERLRSWGHTSFTTRRARVPRPACNSARVAIP